jgi:hypothetical protein
MFRRRPISSQGDLFSRQGDLFAWATKRQKELWRKASLPQRPGEPTALGRLGEAFLKLGQARGDPSMEVSGLRLLRWKLH